MYGLKVVAPQARRPRPGHPPATGSRPANSVGAVRMRATLAIEGVDNLVAAADAAHRAGSWEPGAAGDARDYEALAAARDMIDRWRLGAMDGRTPERGQQL
jgi:hypothetical protein